MALGEVGHTGDVSVGQLGQPQATRPKVMQEPDLGVRAAPLAEEIADLGDHGGPDELRFDEGLEETRRAVVVGTEPTKSSLRVTGRSVGSLDCRDGSSEARTTWRR